MVPIPREKTFDSTLALLAEGYQFIGNRCRRFETDLFETRLMARRAVCMMGGEAARLFYDGERLTRKGAIPKPTLKLLQDKGSVQGLDGAAHRHRKQMFMSLMTPASIQALVDLTARQWRARMAAWRTAETVTLFPEVQNILGYAVCRWAGLPLLEREAKERTREFAAMIDGAGAIGPRNWKGMVLRSRSERWARQLIRVIRKGSFVPPENSAVAMLASHRDGTGKLLKTKIAAVELINLLRPTVAVANYIVFVALALHEHPEWRVRLAAGRADELHWFVEEVRRFYPFFPFVGGRVAQPFEWRGHHFRKGTWLLLDLYGTNHDPRLWRDPRVFRPERFRDGEANAFNFIPQGGGDPNLSHRCPGEKITVELMKLAARLLAMEMHYDVPPQDLRYRLARIPAVPNSRFVISDVRPAP